ncbi:hypothetical protein EYW49_20190 [Siculibacillus lacustris]|uniref:Flagellar protein FlgN n=1 Tax=Siculibacillus lacustris TaxID=1549641 RepID=A0A4Q9VFJ4_9HYPH|nr:hypothetical protein [Siculibacillus lacustris]TBW33499.1 hypothetical protein EYW49_20190 [Siculibacillus lacustris]
MMPQSIYVQPEAEAPIRTEAEARALLADFEAVMSELMELIETETGLVRDGRLFAATDLTARKNDLLGRYMKGRIRLKSQFASLTRLVPDALEPLRQRHLANMELVRANLAALAIAREVAEGIVRNVSSTLGRQAAPRTYGRNAGMPPIRAAAARGIALDRRL